MTCAHATSVPSERSTRAAAPTGRSDHLGVEFPTIRPPRATALAALSVCVAESMTWFAPPVAAMVIAPAAFVTEMPAPAVRAAATGAASVDPMRSCPLVGAAVVVSKPAVPLNRNALAVRPESVRAAKVGVEAAAMLWGSDRVTAPVGDDATTWFAVPIIEETPAPAGVPGSHVVVPLFHTIA